MEIDEIEYQNAGPFYRLFLDRMLDIEVPNPDGTYSKFFKLKKGGQKSTPVDDHADEER